MPLISMLGSVYKWNDMKHVAFLSSARNCLISVDLKVLTLENSLIGRVSFQIEFVVSGCCQRQDKETIKMNFSLVGWLVCYF